MTTPIISPNDRIDDALFEALHRFDGAQRRWAMRRASGQSGRDLRAAIAYEFFETCPLPRPGETYRIGGCPVDLWLTVPGEGPGSAPVEVDAAALAVRARKILRIPPRSLPGPAEVWTIAAGKTDVLFYAMDCETRDEAADLMEPVHHGSTRIKFRREKLSKVPAYIEIRRMPLPADAVAAAGPVVAPAWEAIVLVPGIVHSAPKPIEVEAPAVVVAAGPAVQQGFGFGDPDWLNEARKPGRRKAVRS